MQNSSDNLKKVMILAGLIAGIALLGYGLDAAWANADPWNWIQNHLPNQIGSSGQFAQNNNNPQGQGSLYKPVADYENAVVAAVKQAAPAVVAITVSQNMPVIGNCPGDPFGGLNLPPGFGDLFGSGNDLSVPCQKGSQVQEVGGGSGFIISKDGLILTNKHVVSNEKASYTVFTNDGKKYDAKVLARDPVQDLAVIKIDGNDFPTVQIGDSSNIELGQTAIVIGNALAEFRNTVSVGVISGLARTVTAGGGSDAPETIQGVIQTDAAINPGNSGGPLLNLRGEVIGINTAMAQGAQDIGFAIPINRAVRDIASVKASGSIEYAYLGVRYRTIDGTLAQSEKLPQEYGALIGGGQDGPAIEPNSPADKAGLRGGDIVLEINGTKLDSQNTLSDIVAQHNPGDQISLRVQRGDSVFEKSVTLAKRP